MDIEKPKVVIPIVDGTNCDTETQFAFNQVGGNAEIIHINSLIKEYDPVKKKAVKLEEYDILALAGGFSYGDYLGAGKVYAELLLDKLGNQIEKFIDDKKPVIGICNGFQVLVKGGFLPRLNDETKQQVTLTYNEPNVFRDDWVNLIKPSKCESVWLDEIYSMMLPIAHGEGRFVTTEKIQNELFENGQIAFRYANPNSTVATSFLANPNGSDGSIAGICSKSGLVLGLMPHPERYNDPSNHPLYTLQKILSKTKLQVSDFGGEFVLDEVGSLPEYGLGLKIFKNGVDYVLQRIKNE